MTNLLKKSIFSLVLIGISLQVFAATPKVGSSSNGGTFVYRENIEGGYFVDWVAYLLMGKKELSTTDTVHLTLTGEGKNTFIGNVIIYCKVGEAEWETGRHDGLIEPDETKINTLVPKEVINNSIRQFCKKAK